MPTFAKILDKALAIDPALNREKIEQAFEYADKRHSGQFHQTGDPYIAHCLFVVETLITFHCRETSIIAALLHGLPETPYYNLPEIEKLFGLDVASLLSALEMLNRMKVVDHKSDVDSLRKMFLAMAKDIRVVMIKLADRLQNMERLELFPAGLRKTIAKETLDIYVPISSRMGIYRVKVKLEDLCFKYLYTRQYEVLKAQLNEYKLKWGKNMDQIKKELKLYLDSQGIEAVVEGRIKNLYSIYKKMKLKGYTTLDDIYDVFATRVVLPTRIDDEGVEQNDHLYAVLGLIHRKWKPLVNRFKDYVAVPKPNGYRSLHTAVIGLSPFSTQATEIQIRSQKMHEEAEYGIASHWVYEDLKKALSFYKTEGLQQVINDPKDTVFGKYVSWLDALEKLQRDMHSGSEFMEALKLDVFNDRIFVLTPAGEVRDLPVGATPVDFAYAIHSDVGHRCLLAKVNGSVVPLDYKLKSGQVVEIISGSKPQPKLHWLSFVKTAGARAKIKSYFRGLDKDRSFREGKEMINKFLARMGKPLLDDDLFIFKEYGGQRLPLKDRVAMVEEIGNGSVLAATVLKKIFGKGVSGTIVPSVAEKEALGKIILPKMKKGKISENKNIYIAGETGLPYKFAQCCRPLQGQPIVAYVTRGNAVTIHQGACKILREADQRRIIEAGWSVEKDMRRFPVKVSIRMHDRIGLIRDIAEAISNFNVNIIDFGNERIKDKDIYRDMVIEVADNEQFLSIIDKLQRIRNVFDVQKVD